MRVYTLLLFLCSFRATISAPPEDRGKLARLEKREGDGSETGDYGDKGRIKQTDHGDAARNGQFGQFWADEDVLGAGKAAQTAAKGDGRKVTRVSRKDIETSKTAIGRTTSSEERRTDYGDTGVMGDGKEAEVTGMDIGQRSERKNDKDRTGARGVGGKVTGQRMTRTAKPRTPKGTKRPRQSAKSVRSKLARKSSKETKKVNIGHGTATPDAGRGPKTSTGDKQQEHIGQGGGSKAKNENTSTKTEPGCDCDKRKKKDDACRKKIEKCDLAREASAMICGTEVAVEGDKKHILELEDFNKICKHSKHYPQTNYKKICEGLCKHLNEWNMAGVYNEYCGKEYIKWKSFMPKKCETDRAAPTTKADPTTSRTQSTETNTPRPTTQTTTKPSSIIIGTTKRTNTNCHNNKAVKSVKVCERNCRQCDEHQLLITCKERCEKHPDWKGCESSCTGAFANHNKAALQETCNKHCKETLPPTTSKPKTKNCHNGVIPPSKEVCLKQCHDCESLDRLVKTCHLHCRNPNSKEVCNHKCKEDQRHQNTESLRSRCNTICEYGKFPTKVSRTTTKPSATPSTPDSAPLVSTVAATSSQTATSSTPKTTTSPQSDHASTSEIVVVEDERTTTKAVTKTRRTTKVTKENTKQNSVAVVKEGSSTKWWIPVVVVVILVGVVGGLVACVWKLIKNKREAEEEIRNQKPYTGPSYVIPHNDTPAIAPRKEKKPAVVQQVKKAAQKPRKIACHPFDPKEYKIKGPLVVPDGMRTKGPLKHEMEAESEHSLKRVVFDTKDNELAYIGSDIEIHEDAKETTSPTQEEESPQTTQKESVKELAATTGGEVNQTQEESEN